MSYRAALFDMDGTLVDSLEFHAACFQRFFRGYGLSLTIEETKRMMGNTIKVILNHTLPEALHGEAVDRLAGFYRTQIDDLLGLTRALPQVPETLAELERRGVPLFLVTNSKQEVAERMLHACDLECFRQVVGADRDSLDKTDRCRELLAANGLTPGQVLYVGDSAGDVELAERVGMDSCLVLNKYSWIHKEGVDLASVHPTHRVDAFGKILQLLP